MHNATGAAKKTQFVLRAAAEAAGGKLEHNPTGHALDTGYVLRPATTATGFDAPKEKPVCIKGAAKAQTPAAREPVDVKDLKGKLPAGVNVVER